MARFLVVVGTRPEAIKMAPVIRELRGRLAHGATCVCSTGQHREMLDQALAAFDIVPDIDLAVMQPDQTLSSLSARVLERMDQVLVDQKPEWVLVQGDTTTVTMAAIAAQHRRVRVGHVEAGLRTHDRANPFPEEMNRVLADQMSDLCFAPTERARRNLLREGIADARIAVTGNTAIDALLSLDEARCIPPAGHPAAQVPSGADLILVTAHRRENHDAPLRSICEALARLACERRPGLHIVYPVHRSPHVWEPVHARLHDVPGITLLPPVEYPTLVYLMRRSRLILTDSGGIQEEAPSLRRPVLVLRDVTERPEAVEAGAARVVGTDTDAIVAAVAALLDEPDAYAAMTAAENPFGDGLAARHIVDRLLEVSGSPQEGR